MSYAADEAAMAYGPGKGRVLGDQGTTTSVEYLDCSAFAGSWYRLTAIDTGLYFLWVEDGTPLTAPAAATVSGNGCMDYLPAGASIERRVPGAVNTTLAYVADAAGRMRISFDGDGNSNK